MKDITLIKRPKALVLFSGGLDSRLVIKILKEQELEIVAIYFNLPLGEGCCNNISCVFNFLQKEDIKLNIIDCTKSPMFEEYLAIIRKPKFGRGGAFNPCKDCKIFMLKKAEELRKYISADFLVTGEVLGERPMSQNKGAMFLIEKEAGVEGNVLRPLSAKMLPITNPEKNNLVDREKLLSIVGRRRSKQLDLAKKYKIDFPNPSGGCLLCERIFTKRLRDFLKHNKKISYEELKVLSIGRHFRSNGKIIIGRNKIENDELEILNKVLNLNMIPQTNVSPTIIYENPSDKTLVEDLFDVYTDKDLEKRKKFEKFRIC